MKTVLDRLNLFFETLPERLRARRPVIWLSVLILLVAVGAGLPRVKIDMSLESFFNREDPVIMLFNQFRDTFGSDDVVYIVYEALDGDVLSTASLQAVTRLQQQFEYPDEYLPEGIAVAMEHIVEVDTIVNVSYLEAVGDTLNSRDFVGDDIPESETAREALRREAMSHNTIPGFHISRDSRYGGILIRTDFGTIREDDAGQVMGDEAGFADDEMESSEMDSLDPDAPVHFKRTEMTEYAAFNRGLEQILKDPFYEGKFKFYPVGNTPLMGFFNDVLNVELETLLGGAILLMGVVLLFLFKSLVGVVWPLMIVIVSVIFTMGLAGWAGVTMSIMVSILLMLLLVVGVADAVHVMSGYLFFRQHGQDHQQAMASVMKTTGLACLLTSLTTSLGMFALVFVPIQPIRYFGAFAGIGVFIAFFLTVVFLPLLMDIRSPVSRKRAEKMASGQAPVSLVQRFLSRIEPFSYRYPRQIVVVFFILFMIAGYGLSRVRIDSNLVEIIKRGLPIRVAYDLVDKVMGGSQSMEIYLDFKTEDALKDPKILSAMDELQKTLETEHRHFVVRTISLADVAKESYQVLNEGRKEKYIIPQARPVLEQTLFLFDTANPDDRRLLVPDDYSQGRISIRLLNYGSMEYTEFFETVQRMIHATFDPFKADYPEMTTQLTGSLALMMKMVEYISHSQIQSFGLALAVISFVLFVIFGSLKTGAVAMIPNLFPVMTTFGVMGLFDFALDADTLIIAPIVIGIAVDDTIHFMTHYRAEIIAHGDQVKAIIQSLKEAGQAITFSTVILVIGFFILVTSSHVGMANFGMLSAVAFISALLADFLLLPSLCILFKVDFSSRRQLSPAQS